MAHHVCSDLVIKPDDLIVIFLHFLDLIHCFWAHWMLLLTLVLLTFVKQNKTFSYINCACETLRAQSVLRVSSKIELLMFDILVAFVILKWLHQLPVLPHTVLSCMTGGIVTLFKLWKEEKYLSSERERGREMEGGCEGRLEKTIIMVIGYGFVRFDRGGHIALALLW